MQTVTPPSTLPPQPERASERGALAGLGRVCYRHRRLLVLAWFAIVIVAQALAAAFGGESVTDFQLHGSESDRAGQLLEDGGFGGREGLGGQIVVQAQQGIDNAEVRAYLDSLIGKVEQIDGL